MSRLVLTTLCICFSVLLFAQTNKEQRIKEIQEDIEIIIEQEKEDLKKEVDRIKQMQANKQISEAEAELLMNKAAEKSAESIEKRVAILERELSRLEGEMSEDLNDNDSGEAKMDGEREDVESDILDGLKDLKNALPKKKKGKKYRNEARTTSQTVFGFGLNTLVSDHNLSSIQNNGLKVNNARFYEWGITRKTRLMPNTALFNLKYGISLTYNNLRPDNGNYYVITDNVTALSKHPFQLRNEPYFRTINLVLPLHFEFDFSKKRVREDMKYIVSQKGWRIGVGGYGGINLRTKQKLEYKNNNLTTEETTKGDYNVSKLVYGVSGYIGYRDFSLYSKYDLNPLFRNNDNVNSIVDRNISFGIRYDFH